MRAGEPSTRGFSAPKPQLTRALPSVLLLLQVTASIIKDAKPKINDASSAIDR